jgi:transporter family-2 protein
MLSIIIGFIIGLLVPVQTSVNTRLRGVVGSPFLASQISFSIGSLFLLILVLLVDGNLAGLTAVADEPFWIWAGGILGVIFLTGNIWLFPRLGGVQTVIMPIFDQVITGLLIDHFGLFEANITTLSLRRIIGAALVLLGVVGTVALGDYFARRHKQQVVSTEKSLFLWRLLGIMTGTRGAAQTAINGHLGSVLGSAVEGALISFVIGTIALLLLNLILRTKWQIDRSQPLPAWIWISGLIGALFVAGNAFIVPLVGKGLAVVIVTIGLLTGSLLIDRFGWFGAKKQPVTGVQIISLLVMLGGIVLIRI